MTKESVVGDEPTTSTFSDPLAAALWRARSQGRLVPGLRTFKSPSLVRARAIAAELYAANVAGGERRIAWKLGATGAEMQNTLGTKVPFVAPVYSGSVFFERARIDAQTFIAPQLEVELVVATDGGSVRLAPCIEVIDCRVGARNLNFALAIADFGLQGCFVLGRQVAAQSSTIEVAVALNGSRVFQTSASVDEARKASDWVTQELGSPADVVATGALAPPVPLSAGRWTATFGQLGSLELIVGGLPEADEFGEPGAAGQTARRAATARDD